MSCFVISSAKIKVLQTELDNERGKTRQLTHVENIERQAVRNKGKQNQCLSQDLETGCLKLAVVKFLGVQIFKGDHNYILIFQP